MYSKRLLYILLTINYSNININIGPIFGAFITMSNEKLRQAYNEENSSSMFLRPQIPVIILFSVSCAINLILFGLHKYYPKGIWGCKIYSYTPYFMFQIQIGLCLVFGL